MKISVPFSIAVGITIISLIAFTIGIRKADWEKLDSWDRFKLVLEFSLVLLGLVSAWIQLREEKELGNLLDNANEKIQQQSLHTAYLQQKLNDESKRIRTLSVEVRLKFRGNWQRDLAPFSSTYRPFNLEYLKLASLMFPASGHVPQSLDFYGTPEYRFQQDAENEAFFIFQAVVRPGHSFLGGSTDSLKKVNYGTITLPLVYSDRSGLPHVFCDDILLQITVNDRYILQRQLTYAPPRKALILKEHGLGYTVCGFELAGETFEFHGPVER